MAATKTGVWGLQQVRDKQLASNWGYDAADPGSYFTWGNNNMGQLGQNTTDDISSPVQVPGSWNGLFSSAGGEGTSGGVKTDGTLWTWGFNGFGQGGRNDRVHRSSPVQVGTDTNWGIGGLKTGNYWSMATKTNGTLWTWGRNGEGWLGHNKLDNASSPTQVGTETTWTQIRACGGGAIWGLKTNGTLWSWGYNSFGFTGQNDTVLHSSPCQIGTDTNWQSVRGGSGALAKCTKTDGTLWLWGRNDFGGAIPGGEAFDFSSPVQVPGTSFGPLVGGTQYGVAVVLA